MIRRVMGDGIDVKAGLKLVLENLEKAFNARSKVEINAKQILAGKFDDIWRGIRRTLSG